RRDVTRALDRALHYEPDADPRQPLAARRLESSLAQRELGSVVEQFAGRLGPERTGSPALHVDELVQAPSRPSGRPHALLAVSGRERADGAARRIEDHVEPTRLGLER